MEELCCRFLGVVVGDETIDDEVAAAGSLVGGEGFAGGKRGSLFKRFQNGHRRRRHRSLRWNGRWSDGSGLLGR